MERDQKTQLPDFLKTAVRAGMVAGFLAIISAQTV
jgi:hypothetical protein